MGAMQRAIVAFRQDDAGAWAAELACRHGQHIRHRPPFQLAPWVLDDDEREARIGAPLECPLCDRAELPGDLTVTGRIDAVAAGGTPPGPASLPAGTWGLLHVEEGAVRFRAATEPPLDVEVGPGTPQPIPPEVDYQVEPIGGGADARAYVELLDRR